MRATPSSVVARTIVSMRSPLGTACTSVISSGDSSASEAAPFWHKLGRAIYEEGVPSYNFKGLRSFKSKLQPVWRPRYLAVAGGASPALVLLDATRLIGRGPKE